MGHPAPGEPLDHLPDAEFRQVVRDWVEAHYPPHLRNPRQRLHFRENKPWYMALSAQGWLAPGWPREWGGMGLSAGKQLIMIEEFERHGCARVNDLGVIMLGPLLIAHGTEEQKRFFLPRILSGEHIWAQGYSEPNAGSDLAALRMTAELDGDEWVLNGQKTWTTLGNDANWIFLLVRTDKTVKKQAGISFLLAPMDAPGITVRPILNIDMHDEFCEVFFDNVRVAKDNLVGGLNQGWTMAKTVLGFERIAIGSPKLSSYALDKLWLLARRLDLLGDEAFQEVAARLAMELADLKALYETFVVRIKKGEMPGADASMLKLVQSELFQRITEVMMEVAGEEAGMLEPLSGNAALHPAGLFIQARPGTIYGGSSEILRTVLAKNVLELQG
ncbi:acyl-CoA dehydrogenase family protein [Acetobacteraceae bacterium H6797]|nr:acyl-CoA dehydrogenase family protein [Acetobacteraceae bacterium H6797]